MPKKYLETGKIVAIQGLGGEDSVQTWSDSTEFLLDIERFYGKDGAKVFEVQKSRVQKNLVVAKFAGVDTPEAAAALRGTVL